MKLEEAKILWKGDRVRPKKKNQYTKSEWSTVEDIEITEVNGETFVNVKLDDGKWYGYKELK